VRFSVPLATIFAAVPDAWVIGFQIFTVIVQGTMAFAVAAIGQRQRKTEGLETRLMQQTDKLIDMRFSAIHAETVNSMKLLTLTLEQLQKRLDGGDEELESLLLGKHAIELKIERMFAELKDYVRENSASKDDVHELTKQVEQMKAEAMRSRRGN